LPASSGEFVAAPDQTGDFVIIRILDRELGEEWQAYFYCFDADIMRVENAIQASTAKLSRVSGALDYLTRYNDHIGL
jgi:hypothetical protein